MADAEIDLLELEKKRKQYAKAWWKKGMVKHWPLGKLLPWWTWWYVLDYGMILFIWICAFIVVIVMEPEEKTLSSVNRMSDDWLLERNWPNEIHGGDRWPNMESNVAYVLVPVAAFLVVQIWVQSVHDFHNAMCALLLSGALSLFMVEFLKRIFGSVRPSLLDRIRSGDDFDDVSPQARQTFPSGHASNATAWWWLLTLYLFDKLQPWSRRGDGFFFKYIIAFSPLLLWTDLVVSRVLDFAHFWEDVIAGTFVGAFACFFSYFLYFHAPWHPLAGYPRVNRNKYPKDVFARGAVKGPLCCGPCAAPAGDDDDGGDGDGDD